MDNEIIASILQWINIIKMEDIIAELLCNRQLFQWLYFKASSLYQFLNSCTEVIIGNTAYKCSLHPAYKERLEVIIEVLWAEIVNRSLKPFYFLDVEECIVNGFDSSVNAGSKNVAFEISHSSKIWDRILNLAL